jgi:hypothetical protein
MEKYFQKKISEKNFSKIFWKKLEGFRKNSIHAGEQTRFPPL